MLLASGYRIVFLLGVKHGRSSCIGTSTRDHVVAGHVTAGRSEDIDNGRKIVVYDGAKTYLWNKLGIPTEFISVSASTLGGDDRSLSESLAWLQWIYSRYDDLPTYVLFMHPNTQTHWHRSQMKEVKRLSMTKEKCGAFFGAYYMGSYGYCKKYDSIVKRDLKCWAGGYLTNNGLEYPWNCKKCSRDDLNAPGGEYEAVCALAHHLDIQPWDDDNPEENWNTHFYGNVIGSEVIVSREALLMRPRSFYHDLIKLIQSDTNMMWGYAFG